ncbi:MAG TPA: transglycosylase SLT domain-containing protein, partial [Puia sp.]|nr:transglycosylase SLT domain-containing protein [Puia sp.]
MYNKRLLLLGVIVLLSTFILATGWMYPTQYNGFDKNDQAYMDTDRVAGMNHGLISSSPMVSSSAETAFGQLYLATTVGGSNGVRLNPKALNFVQDYLKENWEDLQDIRSWGTPYFNLIDNILTQYGLPKTLKYLAVIESNLKSTAVSRVGAKGPWQLMPQTARDLGLKVNHNVDERKNYVKSTRAAALYLRDL